MRRCDRKFALVLIFMFLGNLSDIRDLIQDIASDVDNVLAGRGNLSQMFATAVEYLHTQFIFQHTDLLADTRLRGIQAFGRC